MLARVVAGGVERGLRARLLVAAAGGDSNTCTLLGVRSDEFDYCQTAVVANVSLAMLAIDLIPPLKRALVRRAMGFGGPLPRLGRGLPL